MRAQSRQRGFAGLIPRMRTISRGEVTVRRFASCSGGASGISLFRGDNLSSGKFAADDSEVQGGTGRSDRKPLPKKSFLSFFARLRGVPVSSGLPMISHQFSAKSPRRRPSLHPSTFEQFLCVLLQASSGSVFMPERQGHKQRVNHRQLGNARCQRSLEVFNFARRGVKTQVA